MRATTYYLTQIFQTSQIMSLKLSLRKLRLLHTQNSLIFQFYLVLKPYPFNRHDLHPF